MPKRKTTTNKRKIGTQYGRALIQPSTINVETREVEVVIATETPVERFGWEFEEDFDEVLVCDAAAVRMDRANRGLPVMDCHNTYSVFNQIGRSSEVWFDEVNRKLCGRITFSRRASVEELFHDIQDGIVKDISVGYQVCKFERIDQGEGRRPIYRAIDWMPLEISFAPVQADINSEVRTGRAENIVEIINQQTLKTKTIMSKKRSVEEGQTIQYTVEGEPVKTGDIVTLEDGMQGVALDDGEVGDTIDLTVIEQTGEGVDPAAVAAAEEAAAAAEEAAVAATEAATGAEDAAAAAKEIAKTAEEAARKRAVAIRFSTRAAKLPDAFALQLIESKKTVDQCRQAIIHELAKSGPKANGAHAIGVGVSGADKKRSGMQNAILHRVMPSTFKLEDGAREFRGMTLIEMAKELLNERGINTRGLSKMEVADRVFGGQRSISTSDFPSLFGGVIERMLRGDYTFAPEYWDKIARQTTVADFRQKQLYQIDSANGMQKVAEGEEIKYTKMVEGDESIRVESFAEGIKFTRQAFINDDLGAFSIIPSRFVRDWDELRGNLVWGLITGNVTMKDGSKLFSAAHFNLLTGANSALNEAGLSAAQVALRRQKGLDGKRVLRIDPAFLIVPPELEVTARKLITATTPTTTDGANVFANAFDVIVENRLTDKDAWYLSADPNAVDTLYYAYLEGNESLRVNSEDDFNTDAMKYAVRGDFGASAIDYRGMVKSAGK